jgi:hypothetical protein
MASPPYNIFTQHCDPDGALAKLQELLPEAAVTRDADGQWTRIKGTWKRGWLKPSLTLTVNHDPSYYAGPGWATQVDGMAGYFSKFPDAKRRPDLFGYLPGLSFALSFLFDPDSADEDPRHAVVFQMAEAMDGVIFLPGCLVDSQGRVIVAADGESDPEAELPGHEPANLDGEESIGRAGGSEESACEAPNAERVLARLILMTALVNRGFIESSPTDEMESTRQNMIEAIADSPAWEEAESWESDALQTPVGETDDRLKWQLPWLSEGAMVLAWAMELADLPSYDQQVDTKLLYDLEEKVRSRKPAPPLRPLSEMQTLAFQMLAIHWRLRQFHVKGEAMDFAAYAPKAWCGPMDLSLARLIDNDLEVNGRPLSQASEEQWKTAAGIMEERRKAINWLLGHHPVYSETDTST